MRLTTKQKQDILAIPPEIAHAPAHYIEGTIRTLYALGVDEDQREDIRREMTAQALNVCVLMYSEDPQDAKIRQYLSLPKAFRNR